MSPFEYFNFRIFLYIRKPDFCCFNREQIRFLASILIRLQKLKAPMNTTNIYMWTCNLALSIIQCTHLAYLLHNVQLCAVTAVHDIFPHFIITFCINKPYCSMFPWYFTYCIVFLHFVVIYIKAKQSPHTFSTYIYGHPNMS